MTTSSLSGIVVPEVYVPADGSGGDGETGYDENYEEIYDSVDNQQDVSDRTKHGVLRSNRMCYSVLQVTVEAAPSTVSSQDDAPPR